MRHHCFFRGALNHVPVLPKRGCVFEVPLHACDILVTMHGSKLLDLQAAAATAQRQRG